MEAVDIYDDTKDADVPPNIICVQEADNFRTTVLDKSGTAFTAGVRWINPDVWDTDFLDPEASLREYDDDTNQADKSTAALGYFATHGSCNDGMTQSCTTSADCTTPNTGLSLPGACIGRGPTYSTGKCAYVAPKYINVGPYGINEYGGSVNYSTDFVRWGESTLSGNWAGAGTNGNLNFAVISNSCGVKDPFQWQELSDIFAGLHGLGIVMPTAEGSDDVDAPLRGYYFAEAYVDNPGGVIAAAFRNSIASMPQNDGGPCPVGAANYTYGGGEGIGGCGAQMTMSVDASDYWAYYKQTSESWGDVTSDVLDGTGNSYWYYYYLCNYDCNTWPVSQ